MTSESHYRVASRQSNSEGGKHHHVHPIGTLRFVDNSIHSSDSYKTAHLYNSTIEYHKQNTTNNESFTQFLY